ncbi:MAG: alpha-L-fucosidase [bacterium]
MASDVTWFTKARFGMFIHYGLYSLLERGEWVMNRERLSGEAMRALAGRFTAACFDAGALCDLAVAGGMRYVNLTTMHHDGFRLYDTELTDFNAKAVCGRDLVEEFVKAARERGLKVALYHSLNNWTDQPDGVAALESRDAYDAFIARTHARIRELVTRFNPIDVLWYDGWWPFNADGWKSEAMNAMVRQIQPHVLFNGRNGLPGDIATPEGHMSAPTPWRPWEGCMTLNDNWGFHRGDHHWKSPGEVIALLTTAAQGQGNLLLNIGPRGDGAVPEASVKIVRAVGRWLQHHEECLFDTDRFTFGLMNREGHSGDWSHNGPFTRKGRTLYQFVRSWPGRELTIAGLDAKVERVTLLGREGGAACRFAQTDGKVTVEGLPEGAPDPLCPVLRFDCESVPSMYLTGGMRVPSAPHPPYDPCPSDLPH